MSTGWLPEARLSRSGGVGCGGCVCGIGGRTALGREGVAACPGLELAAEDFLGDADGLGGDGLGEVVAPVADNTLAEEAGVFVAGGSAALPLEVGRGDAGADVVFLGWEVEEAEEAFDLGCGVLLVVLVANLGVLVWAEAGTGAAGEPHHRGPDVVGERGSKLVDVLEGAGVAEQLAVEPRTHGGVADVAGDADKPCPWVEGGKEVHVAGVVWCLVEDGGDALFGAGRAGGDVLHKHAVASLAGDEEEVGIAGCEPCGGRLVGGPLGADLGVGVCLKGLLECWDKAGGEVPLAPGDGVWVGVKCGGDPRGAGLRRTDNETDLEALDESGLLLPGPECLDDLRGLVAVVGLVHRWIVGRTGRRAGQSVGKGLGVEKTKPPDPFGPGGRG